ncbi:alpha/beta fold hydrolase [Bacillus inaquosorum]|uniref:alpha/beta fold hydrolase n=1 Tax=Bacillus inaquosorum TaxID=483913 RepID=UPI002282DB87|nr:alpha/beta fold hydrolase [Bacillus inaquosorum]MCY8238437.1 alpha/beta fold hydrolase [Bacillus inaquosorum]
MSTFVFVHGAFQGKWVWKKVTPLLEKNGHKVIAIDLPGSGEDVTPPQEVTFKCYTDKVTSILEKIDHPVILVGHSMSGLVVSQVAEYVPDKIKKLVYVCAIVPQNGQSLQDLGGGPKDTSFNEEEKTLTLIDEYIADGFLNECSDEDIIFAKRKMRPQPVLPFSGKVTLSPENFGRVPRVYIEATKDHAIPIEVQREMYKQIPFENTFSIDADHSPFFSQPETLTKYLNEIATL